MSGGEEDGGLAMQFRAAASVLAAFGLLVWGCAKPAAVAPEAGQAAPLGGTWDGGAGTPSAAAAPALATITAPQVGLGSSAEETAETLPPRVQRFIDSMYGKGRGQLNGAWINAKEAVAHLEVVVPALAHALTRQETMAQARRLLTEIGPRAAPYVRTELQRLRREAAADPILQRATRSLEQLLGGWR